MQSLDHPYLAIPLFLVVYLTIFLKEQNFSCLYLNELLCIFKLIWHFNFPFDITAFSYDIKKIIFQGTFSIMASSPSLYMNATIRRVWWRTSIGVFLWWKDLKPLFQVISDFQSRCTSLLAYNSSLAESYLLLLSAHLFMYTLVNKYINHWKQLWRYLLNIGFNRISNLRGRWLWCLYVLNKLLLICS